MNLRPIAIGLSPNTQVDDYARALIALLQPWKWRTQKALVEVEEWFKNYFGLTDVCTYNAGRSALYEIFRVLGIGKADEVLLQAFTCVAVPNSVAWTGARPVFVDVDETLNIDVKDAEKKITSRTKAIIVQHTFGTAANMDRVSAFCKKNKLLLIEDCAHALGARFKNQKCGTFGDAAFFSFGRDKIVSSVFGGVGFFKDESLQKKLREQHAQLKPVGLGWVLQQLLHPLLFSIILPLYAIGIGKIILWLALKLTLLSYPVYQQEREGKRPSDFPRQFVEPLAIIAVGQLKKLDTFTKIRREHAHDYEHFFQEKKITTLPVSDEGAYLRFSIITKRADELRYVAKRAGVILGNWYHHIIDPAFPSAYYTYGSCPQAEKFAQTVVNLPTYPTLSLSQRNKVKQLVARVCSDI